MQGGEQAQGQARGGAPEDDGQAGAEGWSVVGPEAGAEHDRPCTEDHEGHTAQRRGGQPTPEPGGVRLGNDRQLVEPALLTVGG